MGHPDDPWHSQLGERCNRGIPEAAHSSSADLRPQSVSDRAPDLLQFGGSIKVQIHSAGSVTIRPQPAKTFERNCQSGPAGELRGASAGPLLWDPVMIRGTFQFQYQSQSSSKTPK